MKILFLSECFWPHKGGIEIFGEQLMLGLQQRGFEFVVITSTLEGAPDEEIYKGIQIQRLPLRPGLTGDIHAFKTSLKKIIEIKRQFCPNLYHLNVSGPSFFYHLQSITQNPAPTVFTFHYLIPPSLHTDNLLANMLEKSDWITGVSRAALQHARNFLPSVTERSSMIYNGLKKPIITPTPLSKNAEYILSWGRLVENKGFDWMLKAFSVIAQKYPHLNYWLIGDGPDKQRLQDLIHELNLENRVYFPGKHCSEKTLFKAISGSRVVVIPSHDTTESFGLSALEALQMGRPVITTKHVGLNEVVIHQETGLCFERNNMDSLVCAIETLLNDFNASVQYGLMGKKNAKNRFSLKKMLNEYEHLFRTLTLRAWA
jgi:glycosyltransferase involved in cell wall biosynthesis